MKSSIKTLSKEFSLHVIIIGITLALGYWFLSSHTEKGQSDLPHVARTFIRRSLLALPAGLPNDVGQVVRERTGSDTLGLYLGEDSLSLTLLLDRGRAVFYAHSAEKPEPKVVATIDSLEQYQGEWGQIRLAVDGTFFQYRDSLTYACHHLPLVYVFDGDGACVQVVRTIDQSPYPELRTHMGRTTLEHGRAHNTNVGAFVRDGLLYVLSQQVDPKDQSLILDCYDLEDGQYRYSIRSRGEHQLSNLWVSQLVYVDSALCVQTEHGGYSLIRDAEMSPDRAQSATISTPEERGKRLGHKQKVRSDEW